MNYKKRIYEIIERSKDKDMASASYDGMILIAVASSMIPLMMKTENFYTRMIDICAVIVFILDYILRLYTSDYKMGFKSYKSYLMYALTPMAIVDFLSILPILYLFFPSSMFLKLFRIVRVLRVLKLVRYSKSMVTITNVLRKVRKQLFAVLILTFVYIIASAMMIFQIEPDLFPNFLDAIYWSTISITTIGYGDISPVTSLGRSITIISALVGVAIIALPSGIITAAYMDEIKKKKTKLEL